MNSKYYLRCDQTISFRPKTNKTNKFIKYAFCIRKISNHNDYIKKSDQTF